MTNALVSTFDTRMTAARALEDKVERSLRKYGWQAGRADLISPDLRAALMPATSAHRVSAANVLRWTPDLFAVRGAAKYLVEAKATTSTTTNHSIEYMSLSSLERWYRHTGMMVIIVWHDGRLNLHTDLLTADPPAVLMDGRGANGSGTPFYLWPKDRTRPWLEVFGPDAPIYGQDPSWKVI